MALTTWEIGKQIEKIMERGERAAELELINEWANGTKAAAELKPLSSDYETQKAIWARLINWKGVIIR